MRDLSFYADETYITNMCRLYTGSTVLRQPPLFSSRILDSQAGRTFLGHWMV